MATLYVPDTATNPTTVTTAANFIKELWPDEVLAVYKANTVMVPLVQSMPFSGQKGNTVNIPKPARGSVNSKPAGTGVTINVETSGTFALVIDQHFEYSRLIEDIAKIQAMDSMRAFYTDDAGYAHALALDTAVHEEGATFSGSHATPLTAGVAYNKAVIATITTGDLVAFDGSLNTNTGNGVAMTDASIRRRIQYLDDLNVPARMRQLVIPPVEKNNLMGISRFTEQAFVGDSGSSNPIRTPARALLRNGHIARSHPVRARSVSESSPGRRDSPPGSSCMIILLLGAVIGSHSPVPFETGSCGAFFPSTPLRTGRDTGSKQRS